MNELIEPSVDGIDVADRLTQKVNWLTIMMNPPNGKPVYVLDRYNSPRYFTEFNCRSGRIIANLVSIEDTKVYDITDVTVHCDICSFPDLKDRLSGEDILMELGTCKSHSRKLVVYSEEYFTINGTLISEPHEYTITVNEPSYWPRPSLFAKETKTSREILYVMDRCKILFTKINKTFYLYFVKDKTNIQVENIYLNNGLEFYAKTKYGSIKITDCVLHDMEKIYFQGDDFAIHWRS